MSTIHLVLLRIIHDFQWIAAIESSSENNVMNFSLLGRGVKVKMGCRMFNFSEVVIYNV